MSEARDINNDAIGRATRAIGVAQHVLALVGAGISVESGIPPFRGPDGIWTKHGEPSMDGFLDFLRDPEGWWREVLEPSGPRAELLDAVQRAEPNAGHEALAELEQRGYLKCTITQNIDDLHARAGSRHLAEIHGNIKRLRCVQCRARYPRADFPLDPEALPPRCEHCGGLIKSDAVLFGEPIPGDVATLCQEQAALCDCMLVIGTSATVYPAAGFADDVLARGGTLVEINRDGSELSQRCHVAVRDSAAHALPRLAAALAD